MAHQMAQELHHLRTSNGAGKEPKVEIPPGHSRHRLQRLPVCGELLILGKSVIRHTQAGRRGHHGFTGNCYDRGVTHGGTRLDSRTVIWAAGVAASPLGKALGASADVRLDRAGRVIVNQDLSVADANGVFAIGDLASILSGGKPVPGLSPSAMQEGRYAAKNILRLIRGEPTLPFRYRDKGTFPCLSGRSANGN